MRTNGTFETTVSWLLGSWIVALAIAFSVIGMRMGYSVTPGSNGRHRTRKYLMTWKKRVIKKNLQYKWVRKDFVFTI